jgi:ADP-ribosylglycohydrolase
MAKFSIARGALLGAFVGDASGAKLEFLGRKPSAEDVEKALSMVGGGCWRVAPGQVTDDGELALCLARSLADAQAVDRDKIARAYVDWFHSEPFDCGTTTSKAFGQSGSRASVTADLLEECARKRNMASKANGALMRSIGLGIWSWRLSAEDAANVARVDARLSHPNPSCQHANAAYVAAVRHLIFNAGDSSGAFRAASAALHDEGAEEVRGWLREAESALGPPYHPNEGFVRIAFTHAPFGI